MNTTLLSGAECSEYGAPERLPLYLTLLAVLVCVLFDGELE